MMTVMVTTHLIITTQSTNENGGIMRKLTTAVFLCSALFGAPVLAGSDHEHGHGHSHGPVASDAVAEKAIIKIQQLAQSGKIDVSWSGVKPATVEQKTYSQSVEWVVTFKNDKVSDASKQTLYLFYSLDGRYIAANHTGN
jgi:hypothetical protein